MSYIKLPGEIELLREGGEHMGRILEELARMVVPGISAWEIDVAAERMIREVGGVPAFKGYQPRGVKTPFPSTICASVNHEVVHGIASKEKILQDGDIFTIDIGMVYPDPVQGQKDGQRGMYTDTAITVPVGTVSKEASELVRVTERALEAGIAVCRAGNTVADIGRAVEEYTKSQGRYGIVRDLCGHGVGHAVHEEPYVLNYYDEALEQWELRPGAVIAIEPMITLGGYKVKTLPDEWTIVTADKSISAHFEHTIVITEGDPIVVTRRPGERKVENSK